jgi:DNA-binding NtrC family response regulator
MEAELFGAEAGAYTGISSRRIGHFETAHRGTLFLDEVDALSLQGQVALLRILQSGEFQRLGSSRTHRADVRVISATNADLTELIAAGKFREDLYYRLNVVELELPALAARRDDVLPLARHFLARHATDAGGRAATFAHEAEQALLDHDWPGNVRELENRVQRATLLARQGAVRPTDLGLDGGAATTLRHGVALDQDERQQMLDLLARHRGVVSHAADELGISRQALYRRMARLGIEVERRACGARRA